MATTTVSPRQRVWVRLVAIALMAPAFGAALVAGAGQERAAVRFAFWGDLAERDAYERVVGAFEARRPDIDLVVDYTPGQSDYYRKLATDFAGGVPPDLFLANYRQFGQYAARNALEPIGPFLDASSSIAADDYAPVALDAFRFGGALTCMPQNVSSLVVYYNEDLFRANDVPLPRAGWTWDEFVAAATSLTRDTDGDGTVDLYGVVVEPTLYRMAPFVWSAGGEVVDDPDDPTTLTLDSADALDGLTRFLSLGVAAHNVVPPEAEVAAEDDASRFMRGGAAMFLQSRREVPTLRQVDGFTWDVAPLPIIDEAATVLHSDAFCMAAASGATDAAWSFVEFAAGEEGQSVLAETGRIVPALERVARSPVFLDGAPIASPEEGGSAAPAGVAGAPPASSEVFLDNIPIARRLPATATWPEVEDAFNAEFDRAFYEPVDVAAAVAAATASSVDAFARAREIESAGS